MSWAISKPISPVGLLAARWSKNSGNEELLLYVNLRDPPLILLTYGDHNPKRPFFVIRIWSTASLLNQIVSLVFQLGSVEGGGGAQGRLAYATLRVPGQAHGQSVGLRRQDPAEFQR